MKYQRLWWSEKYVQNEQEIFVSRISFEWNNNNNNRWEWTNQSVKTHLDVVSRRRRRRIISLRFENDFCRVSQLINAHLKCDNAMPFVRYYTHSLCSTVFFLFSSVFSWEKWIPLLSFFSLSQNTLAKLIDEWLLPGQHNEIKYKWQNLE